MGLFLRLLRIALFLRRAYIFLFYAFTTNGAIIFRFALRFSRFTIRFFYFFVRYHASIFFLLGRRFIRIVPMTVFDRRQVGFCMNGLRVYAYCYQDEDFDEDSLIIYTLYGRRCCNGDRRSFRGVRFFRGSVSVIF